MDGECITGSNLLEHSFVHGTRIWRRATCLTYDDEWAPGCEERQGCSRERARLLLLLMASVQFTNASFLSRVWRCGSSGSRCSAKKKSPAAAVNVAREETSLSIDELVLLVAERAMGLGTGEHELRNHGPPTARVGFDPPPC